MCRKHHGTPFASFVVTPRERFRWLEGEARVAEYRSSPTGVRRHCPVCGSKAPTTGEQMVAIPAGNLVGELGPVEASHAFVGSKAPWHVIVDALHRYDGPPPSWTPANEPSPPPAVPEGAVHGSCLCGDVSFLVRGKPARWMQCHCSRCRRGRSAAHGSNTFFPRDQFEWRSGRSQVRKYKLPEAERFAIHFCERCGGAAPVEREAVPFVLVPAAILDGDLPARPEAHIHVASKAPWYPITDTIPQFPGLPPG